MCKIVILHSTFYSLLTVTLINLIGILNLLVADWNLVIECGLNIPRSDISLVYDNQEKYDSVPWNVGVYRKNETINIDELICSGTLISQNLVVSGR